MKRLCQAYACGSEPIDNCFWNRSVPLPKLPSLTGSLTVDVAVIGAGYTGLSSRATSGTGQELRWQLSTLRHPFGGPQDAMVAFAALGARKPVKKTLITRFGEARQNRISALRKRPLLTSSQI